MVLGLGVCASGVVENSIVTRTKTASARTDPCGPPPSRGNAPVHTSSHTSAAAVEAYGPSRATIPKLNVPPSYLTHRVAGYPTNPAETRRHYPIIGATER